MNQLMTKRASSIENQSIQLLMVDDSEWDIELTRNFIQKFEEMSIQFDYCLSLEKARRRVREQPPDLMLLDVQFQEDFSGMDFLANLQGGKNQFPVIVLSAFHRDRIAARSFRLGAIEFLSKQDLSLTTLRYVVNSALTFQGDESFDQVDALTQLPNQNFIRKELKKKLNRPGNGADLFSLILIEIDQFRNLLQGNMLDKNYVLKEIGHTIKTTTRPPGEIASRFGGEEFCVLMELDDRLEAEDFVNSVMSKLNGRFCEEGTEPNFSVSFNVGITFEEKNEQQVQPPRTFIQRAETALKEARDCDSGPFYVEQN